jgi:SAM-dependent methyltransferase
VTAPATWHYGLVAKWWAEFSEDGPEIAYFQKHVERGQPALDVACGTGRLLIPYLRAGLDVDGCDLFVQPMHELDPPRTYKTGHRRLGRPPRRGADRGR